MPKFTHADANLLKQFHTRAQAGERLTITRESKNRKWRKQWHTQGDDNA